MKMNLYRSHRVFGYEIDRWRGPDGIERALLQTAPHKEDVSPVHLLMPVSSREVAFEVQAALIEVIERARFLGLDDDALQQVFRSAQEKAAPLIQPA